MHADDVSFYPKAGLFRQGRRLYNVRHLKLPDRYWCGYIERGARIMCTVTIGGPFETPVNGDSLWSVLKVDHTFEWPSYMHLRPTITGVYPAIHVWRIQRAIRRFLRWRFEWRALATVMGLHARLGQECVFACLPADVLALCVE